MIGQTLSHYEIKQKLGSGGMGEVYRAHDAKLGRDVALKVLPTEMAKDPERRKRFEREARAVASLKHPNIVTIHSVEEANETHFITMELVEGQTLSALIPKNGLSLEQFFDFAVSMTDAVSSAHQKGITHRDLKPANIMQDADGRVKVLDFGLAKLLNPDEVPDDEKTVADSDTAEGVVLGTVAYMSPEQAEGKDIDQRSDIFSLGVILYEMATGTRPFKGDTRISTISSILRDEPTPVTEVKQTLPHHLGRIVKRCMAKSPTRRYQSALDLRNDLEELKEEVASGEVIVTGEMAAFRRPAERPKWLVPVIAVAGIAVVALAVTLFNTSRQGPADTIQAPATTLEMTPITTNGYSSEATISADGRYVCYMQEGAPDKLSLWVAQVATGSAVEIVPARENHFIWDPTFSPDGNFIYYVERVLGPEEPALYRIPVLGGAAQRVKDDVGGRVSFSPDGSEFVFLRTDPGRVDIVAASVAGGAERVIGTRQFPKIYTGDPVWSPDGQVIAMSTRDLAQGVKAGIVAIPAEGGDEHEFATDDRWTGCGEMSWLPDGSGVLVEIEHSFVTDHIWEVAYPSGASRRITSDLNSYHGVELTADGGTIVTQQNQSRTNLWTVTRDGEARQITNVGKGISGGNVGWLPDGRVIYDANLGGNWDLYMVNRDGTQQRRLTVNAGTNLRPAASPDGEQMVWISDRSGSIELWKGPVEGGGATQLTDVGFAVDPTWVSDDVIVFLGIGSKPGQISLYKMSADGSDIELLTDRSSNNPVASPDGTRVMCFAYYPDDQRFKIDVVVVETGETTHSFYIEGADECTWSPDGNAIHYSVHTDGIDNIWSQPLDGGDPTQITHLTGDDIFNLHWSYDGQTLLLSRGDTSRDVVLIKNFR